jgi:hypothetical protein
MRTLSFAEKLRIQFQKAIRKGHARNAVLDPIPHAAITLALAGDEFVIVKVEARTGNQYWFTSSRLLEQDGAEVRELIRYDEFHRAHWMFRNLHKRIASGEGWHRIKLANFDQIEIEADDDTITLEGLEQAYWPVLHFFQWAAPDRG